MKKIQCGGFYVDDGAIETRDGKPFLKTGGTDPIVDNAKSTGGIGWTESGEQTVITWDGDTEGRESVTVAGTMYKVSDKIITQSDVIGGEYSSSAGITKPITEGRIFDLASVGIENAFGITFEEGTPSIVILCVQNDTVFADTPISAGVYFQYADAYVSSLTYGTPDTIHKIDEKYLSASGGGAMVVEFVADEDTNITSNKTVDEILDAESTGTNIIGVLYQDGDDVPLAEHLILTSVVRGVENELGFVFFNTKVNAETFAITFQPLYAVYYNGTKWIAGMAI